MTGETASIEQFRLGQLEPPHIHVRGSGARAKFWISPIELAENIGFAAHELSFDTNMLWVSLADGRQPGVLLAYFPRLLKATVEQLDQVRCVDKLSLGEKMGTIDEKNGMVSCWKCWPERVDALAFMQNEMS